MSGALRKRWYVEVGGTVYGPFDDTTLWTYVQEGRVTTESNLSLSPDGPYRSALNIHDISHWFRQPERQTRSLAPLTASAQAQTPSTITLIMAEIRSGQSLAFLQTLQSLGSVERIGDAVWLLKSTVTPDQAQKTLEPTLSTMDRLFILDATQGGYSAHNLGAALDARVQALFNEGA